MKSDRMAIFHLLVEVLYICSPILEIGIEWDPDLSFCANFECDIKRICTQSRYLITQNNIKEKLGLPGDEIYQHVSFKRRSEVHKRKNSDDENMLAKKQKIY